METQQKAYFNEGFFQARRIGDIQMLIKEVRNNLTAYNIQYNCYNYEVYLNCLKSLLNEINKITKDDQRDALILQRVTEDTLKYFSPHKTIIKEGTNTKKVVLNTQNWEKCRNILEIFERGVRYLLDTYGLANPNIEMEGLF